MIYVLTIAGLLIPFILIFVKNKINWKNKSKHQKKVDKYIDVIDILINFSITIIGVTLAILLTNHDINQQNIAKTTSLLSILDEELKQVQGHIEEFYLPACEQLNLDENQQESIEFYQAQPISDIFTLDSVLNNELVVTNTSYYSYTALIDAKRAIIDSYERLDIVSDDDSLLLELTLLNENIIFMQKIIENEISYQDGKISSEMMEEKIKSFYEQLYVQ